MRLKTLWWSLAAFAALPLLGACSSDAPDSSGNEVGNGDKYIAIQINNVNNTRDGENEGTETNKPFEDGTGNENGIAPDNTYFFFFKSDGTPYTMTGTTAISGIAENTNVVKPTSIATSTTDGNNTTLTTGILVLGKPSEGWNPNTGEIEPAYIICVANPGENFSILDLANKNISEMAEKMSNANGYDFNTFTMTNASYVEGEGTTAKVVYATPCEGHFEASAAAAQNNPVQLYVERLAAKVRVSGLDTSTVKALDNTTNKYIDQKFKIYKKGGSLEEDVILQVELTGWCLTNEGKDVRLIKDIQEGSDIINPYPTWNDGTNYRSYWEITSNVTDEKIAKSNYDISDASKFPNRNFSTIGTNEAYTLPNTSFSEDPAKLSDRKTLATSIVVRGIIKKDDQPVAIAQWGGALFYIDALKEKIVENYNYNKAESDKISVNVVDFELESSDKNTYVATIKGTRSDDYKNIRYWKDGETSYWVTIRHHEGNGTASDPTLYGVVRNHIYDTTIDEVIGLGVPGNAPVDFEDAKETYLAARINVLNWRVVSNKVTLE